MIIERPKVTDAGRLLPGLSWDQLPNGFVGILCILIDFYASNLHVSDFLDSLLITDTNEPSNSLCSNHGRTFQDLTRDRLFPEVPAMMLGAMSPHACHACPSNVAFHNLCAAAQAPPGTASLLGLGLKFCIEPPRPCQDLDRSMHPF
jgi:hypothetical protein